VRDLCAELGAVRTLEHLYVGRIRGLVPYTAACNSMFQGLGADCAKTALYEVCKRSYDPAQRSVLYGSRPVNFVHDQVLGEAPGYDRYPASQELVVLASEHAKEASRVMVEAANRYLPDVPVRCEPSLCKVWSKNTEPVYDRDRNVIAWDLARDARAEVYDSKGKMVVWPNADAQPAQGVGA
jgi:DNA polymerase-1